MDIGPTELIIILIIVVLLFGVGRISKVAEELGKGIHAFREGLQGDEWVITNGLLRAIPGRPVTPAKEGQPAAPAKNGPAPKTKSGKNGK